VVGFLRERSNVFSRRAQGNTPSDDGIEEVALMALPHEHVHDAHSHEPVVERETAAIGQPFGVAQLFALGIGIFFVVIGAVGLARTGVDHLTTPVRAVGPFTMTPLLALIHIGVGLAALVGATGRSTARSICIFLGPLLIAGGIIALIQPVAQLGWNRSDGVIYVILGGVAMIAALMTPAVAMYEERKITTA